MLCQRRKGGKLLEGADAKRAGACGERTESKRTKMTWAEKARFQDVDASRSSKYESMVPHSLTVNLDPVGFPLTTDHCFEVQQMFELKNEILSISTDHSEKDAIVTGYEQHDLTFGIEWQGSGEHLIRRRAESRERASHRSNFQRTQMVVN